MESLDVMDTWRFYNDYSFELSGGNVPEVGLFHCLMYHIIVFNRNTVHWSTIKAGRVVSRGKVWVACYTLYHFMHLKKSWKSCCDLPIEPGYHGCMNGPIFERPIIQRDLWQLKDRNMDRLIIHLIIARWTGEVGARILPHACKYFSQQLEAISTSI